MLVRQLPLVEMTDDLEHGQGPEVDKVARVTPAVLTRDLPSRLAPVPGKPLHFAPQVAGTSVESCPVNDSWQLYFVYSPIA